MWRGRHGETVVIGVYLRAPRTGGHGILRTPCRYARASGALKPEGKGAFIRIARSDSGR